LFESHLFINGRPLPNPAGMTYDRRDPLSDAVITRAAAGRVEDALHAADAAAAAFPAWSRSDPQERARILLRASEIFGERADEVVGIAAEEVGSSEEWMRFNIQVARDTLRHAATLVTEIGESDGGLGPDGRRYTIRRSPAGAVLGIAPWNAPVALATRAVAAPLACGNTVVLKGSELCPKTHEWVVQALCDAGLPAGTLNFITNAPDQAEAVVKALIAHPAIRRINFTGSTRVGREIAVVAARNLKRCLLELSGKGTMIVLEDADLDAAAKAAVHGSFFNQGQVCMSTERIVVEEAVADAFCEKFADATRALTRDAGDLALRRLGTMIGAEAVMRVRGLIDDAVARGARLALGGEVFNTTMRPAILDHVSPGMRIFSEEAFGPVAAIIRVSDAEEALSVANETEFGLVATVFSTDTQRAEAMMHRIEAGIGHVNGSTLFDDPRMPFGGVKASGYGRFGGRDAVAEFTEVQWISVRNTGRGASEKPAGAGKTQRRRKRE
jgi:acyl-CoA reductase-like NAD-dependent aldehyde dehydrogenase